MKFHRQPRHTFFQKPRDPESPLPHLLWVRPFHAVSESSVSQGHVAAFSPWDADYTKCPYCPGQPVISFP